MRWKNPGWIQKDLLDRNKLDEFPDELFEAANKRLLNLFSRKPLVSIVIAAYNEESNIVRCLDSLSRSNSLYPLEIIVVDNNSNDRTHEAINRFMVRYVSQPIQGCGIARQIGLETAKGKYILTADADTLYPPDWVNEMVEKLDHPGVVCVYGHHSFLADEGNSRVPLLAYETLGDMLTIAKSIKRPYLNAHGMTMGFVRELALRVGYVRANVRGEDGRLALDLMKFGKIVRVSSNKSRVWTGLRTIAKDGNLWIAVRNRATMALANLADFFTKPADHDTKTSPSSNYDYQHNVNRIKAMFGFRRTRTRGL